MWHQATSKQHLGIILVLACVSYLKFEQINFFFSRAEITSYGWNWLDRKLQIVWDILENMARVQERLDFVFSGL